MPPRPTVGCALRRVAVVLLLSAACLTPLTVHADAEAIRLGNEAVQLYQQGDYRRALLQAKAALDRATEMLGERDPTTLTALSNYAALLRAVGRAAEAEPLYKRALDLRTEELGDKHPDTVASLNGYAFVLNSLGRYVEAEPLLRRALELRTKTLGGSDPNLATSLSNYAFVLQTLRRAAEAEPLYKRTLDLHTKILGEKHPDTLTSLNNYAFVLENLGRAAEAEQIYKRALDLRTEILGEKHPNTLTSLNNYALVLENLGRAAEAEQIYKRALDLRTEILGEKHPDTLTSLNNYALVLVKLGRDAEAEPLAKRALDLFTEILGEKHPDTLASLNNYALVLRARGRTAEAELHYKRDVELNADAQEEANPQTLTMALNHAITLLALDRDNEALDQLEWGVSRLHGWSGDEMRAMSRDAGRRELLTRSSNWINVILTVALQRPSPRAAELAAQSVLRWKHRATEEDALLARLLRGTTDPVLRAKAEQADQLRRDVAGLARHDNDGKFNTAAQQLDAIMRDLRQSQRDPDLFTAAEIVSPAMIAVRLPQGSTLIEFRLYQTANFKTGQLGAHRLAAVLIKLGRPPLIYDAGTVADLARLASLAAQGDRMAAGKLFASAFGPAAERLKTATSIFIAPDGPLWDVSPAVLRAAADGDFWLKDKPLRLLALGRELLSRPTSASGAGFVAVGGIDFGAFQTAAPVPAPAPAPGDSVRAPAALLREVGGVLAPLNALEHSEKEVSFLENLYEGAAGPVTALYGATATEAALKHLPKPPKVLHLATHGNYRALEKFPDRPEVMSWVALAGANRGLEGEVDADGEDGLLTALEAAALPLEGTELVALSACLTGAGRKDYSEGLIGLTRAFRIAGARRVLAALRTVPDDLTADFMIAFHRQWLADGMKDAQESLRRVQLTYADDPDPKKRDPAFWGAFVMVGP